MEVSGSGSEHEWTILTAAECLRLFEEVEGGTQQMSPGKPTLQGRNVFLLWRFC